MNRDIDNSAVNMFCEFISYIFRQFKNEVLFERVITVVLSMAIVVVSACSLAADSNTSSSSDKSKQADPFSEKDRKAGDRAVKVVNGVEFAFRWCPPGTYTMGSPESENGRSNNETQRQVTFANGFWMMETEVTVAMFRAFIKDTGYKLIGEDPVTVIHYSTPPIWGSNPDISWDNPGFTQSSRHPVTCVSWDDAMAFCNWLKGKIGKKIQLPTDKQWEYACRAGTTGTFSGNLDDVAWYWDNSNTKSHPVGMKKPNAWGLFDMHGNVWEWCLDVIDINNGAGLRVRRGGGFGAIAEGCRCARRYTNIHTKRSIDIGFRCAIVPDPVPVDLGVGTQAGERKTCIVNDVEFAFRWCPPGTFIMGSPESEEGRKNDEQQHRVTLTKGFWMMETEVTQEQWEAIMRNNPSWRYTEDDYKRPVQHVSWNSCQEFCNKCTELGLPLQLPTEAQWEYACRSGTKEAYAGDLDEMAWYNTHSNIGKNFVRTKMPNAWGLYDMHGSVCELCSDWYAEYPRENVTDPEGPSSGSYHVMRGGYYEIKKEFCRSANRSKCKPDLIAPFIGFRCVVGKGVSSTHVSRKASSKPRSNVIRISKFGQGTKAGERKTAVVNGVEYAFRWCPPGAFMMGSPESEEERSKNERQHEVTLTKGFWMMETEVTQEQWESIMDDNNSYINGDKLPVERVTWNECQEFCINCADLGLPIQLPTEAQWEYACRAGTTGAYAGNLEEMGWYNSNSGNRTHLVGKKKPNAWGLYDMHGNVAEWCLDCYEAYPNESVTDPVVSSADSSIHIFRGGDRRAGAPYCRSACRNKGPDFRYDSRGLRCVINP